MVRQGNNMATRKINGTWYADFRYKHKRYRIKSPSNTRENAKKFEASLISDLMANRPIVTKEAKFKYFADFAWHWHKTHVHNNNKPSEISSKESILRTDLVPYFGKFEFSQISNLSIEEYKQSKVKQKMSNKTINNHLSVLRKCLSIAQEDNLLEKMPIIRMISVTEKEMTCLTDSECTALLANTTGVLHDMIFFALRTGLRFGELIALDWQNVDLTNRRLTISRAVSRKIEGSTKSNKPRYIPMSHDLYNMLLHMDNKIGYVFKNGWGNRVAQFNSLRALKRACKRAGIRRVGWHIFRHTFASRMVQKNVSLRTVQILLGHSDIKTTIRYAHINTENLEYAVNVLDDPKIFGHPAGKGFNMPLEELAFSNQSLDKYTANIKQKDDA